MSRALARLLHGDRGRLEVVVHAELEAIHNVGVQGHLVAGHQRRRVDDLDIAQGQRPGGLIDERDGLEGLAEREERARWQAGRDHGGARVIRPEEHLAAVVVRDRIDRDRRP